MHVNPGQIAACNPTWPGAPLTEQKQAVSQGPYAELEDPYCARGLSSSRARAKGPRARVSRAQVYPPPPHSSVAEPKTQMSESPKHHPIYSIGAPLVDVLETSATSFVFLCFHASFSIDCGQPSVRFSGLCSELCCRRGRRLGLGLPCCLFPCSRLLCMFDNDVARLCNLSPCDIPARLR